MEKIDKEKRKVLESEPHAQLIPIPKPKPSKIGWLINVTEQDSCFGLEDCFALNCTLTFYVFE